MENENLNFSGFDVKQEQEQEQAPKPKRKSRAQRTQERVDKNNELKAVRRMRNKEPIKEEMFATIRQGIATNELTKLPAIATHEIDEIGTARFISPTGELELIIPNFNKLDASLKTTSFQLLDAMVLAFTNNTANGNSVILPLDRFMEIRGLSDVKEAKKQIKATTKALFHCSLTFNEKRGEKIIPYRDMHLIIDRYPLESGNIVFTFHPDFYALLTGYPVMQYPLALQKINSHKNPNAYYMGRKIAELKNMNRGNPNEDLISVRTLLANAPALPSYAEVMATGKHIDQQIIKPFERDLDALHELGSWCFCHSNGKPLTDDELAYFNYTTFENCLVLFKWHDYPAQEKRLEAKQKRIEQKTSKK